MTKPTGRPRGRPKTKEYVTLMARVPQDLADRVQRYAGRKRQTISDMLRDGLLVLLQEDDPYRQFTSDTNTAEDITSDMKEEEEEPPDAQPVILSDVKEEQPVIVSDTKKARQRKRAKRDNVSDMKEDQPDILSDGKKGKAGIVSDTKKVRARKQAKRP
jgi:hypothetical protein